MPGNYELTENISQSFSSACIFVKCSDVVFNGKNHVIANEESEVDMVIAAQPLREVQIPKGIYIAPGLKNIYVGNVIFQNFPNGGIHCRKSGQIHIFNTQFYNCGYALSDPTEIFPGYKYFSFGILLEESKRVTIEKCTFREVGISSERPSEGKRLISSFSICICSYKVDGLAVKKCTIDGCVGKDISYGLALISSDVVIDDLFVTDIFSRRAQSIYHFDSSAAVKNFLETAVISNIPFPHFGVYLKTHGEDPSAPPIVKIKYKREDFSHIKNIIPKHVEKEEELSKEHNWRDFRTLGRLVCHNSHRTSKTVSIYGKWIELFCDRVLNVKLKVQAAFSNLYPTGETPLALHRDAYKKWIIGLSFGGTRTLEFIPDSKDDENFFFKLEAGDILIFSPGLNDYYQHQIPKEPEQTRRRINVTYFLEVFGDEKKLLSPPTFNDELPSFEEAEILEKAEQRSDVKKV